MGHEQEAAFDARGLLGYEARLQADIRVAVLPSGKDPDDVVLADPGAWDQIIRTARPVVVHVMDSLAAGRDLDDAKVKADIARQVLPLIEEVADAVEREAYRQKLARLLRVDERSLVIGSGPGQPRRRPRIGHPAQKPRPSEGKQQESRQLKEAHCLGILLRRPDLVYRIDRKLQEDGLVRLRGDDFQRTDFKTVFQLILESIDQDDEEPLHFVLNRLSLPMMEVADDLLVRTQKMDQNDDKIIEDLLRGLLDLRLRDTRQSIDHIRYLIQEAQEQGDLFARQYQESMKQYTLTRNRIDRALGQYTNHSMQPH
jgi:DNA primase